MTSLRRLGWLIFLFALCAGGRPINAAPQILVSVPEQRMVLIDRGVLVGHFPVSTSKFGLGDRPKSFATPLGKFEVAAKVGSGAPKGAVFKGQRLTGEILKPNARGRDPIVTRILHLRGLEAHNARAFERMIYIHGTPEERKIGRPASYGCIRMRSRDVMQVFDAAAVGTKIEVVNMSLRRALAELASREALQNGRKLAAN